jgi:hypothetical protein
MSSTSKDAIAKPILRFCFLAGGRTGPNALLTAAADDGAGPTGAGTDLAMLVPLRAAARERDADVTTPAAFFFCLITAFFGCSTSAAPGAALREAGLGLARHARRTGRADLGASAGARRTGRLAHERGVTARSRAPPFSRTNDSPSTFATTTAGLDATNSLSPSK